MRPTRAWTCARCPPSRSTPTTPKDFDDAISARREDGRVRLWVHIADVTAYVRPGGPLEREALRRGTSVYVPGAVEPMLPEALSNRGLLAAPGRGQARGHRRDGDGRRRGDERGVPPLAACAAIAGSLTARSTRCSPAARAPRSPGREPLEVAARGRARPSRRARATRSRSAVRRAGLRVRSDGHVTGVRYEQQTESHRLIEKLMILANEQVAGYLPTSKRPTLYRVHERPEPQSVDVPLRAARRASASRRRRCRSR